MRKGVVLLITLSLVMMLSFIIIKSTTITQSYLKNLNHTLFYAQFNRSFLDIFSALKKRSSQIENAEAFKILLSIPIIFSDKKSGIDGMMELSSGADVFNINSLLNADQNNSINQDLYDVIYTTLLKYEVADSMSFMNLLLDTIDKDANEREYNSEIAYAIDAKLRDGGIENKKAFSYLLDFYAKEHKDTNIYKVPWSKIIGFSEAESDYNYLTKEIKEILYENYGISDTSLMSSLASKDEDLSLNEEQKSLLKSLNISYYVPILKCNFRFFYMDEYQQIAFRYDLKTKRVSDIETTF